MDECTWQPIETAPQDGTLILIKDSDGDINLAEWRRERYITKWSSYFAWIIKGTYGDEQGGESTIDNPVLWFPLSSIKEK